MDGLTNTYIAAREIVQRPPTPASSPLVNQVYWRGCQEKQDLEAVSEAIPSGSVLSRNGG